MPDATAQAPTPRPPDRQAGFAGESTGVMNLPNRITIGRFVVSVIYFFVLAFADDPLAVADGTSAWGRWRGDLNSVLHDVAFTLFLIAACTDYLDGYFARKYNLVTDFGRVTDPFVDKISVCGSFVFFVSFPSIKTVVPAWIVVAILAREFLVHGIRSLAESKGIPFPAKFWGKQKMVVQCIAVCTVIFYMNHFNGIPWAMWTTIGVVYVALFFTIMSGAVYLWDARRVFQP